MMHSGRPRMRRAVPAVRRRRSLWPIVVALLTIAVLAFGWCGLWYLAATTAGRTLAGWIEAEAAAGRTYACGSQDISGFPLRVVVRCTAASAALERNQPPLALAARQISFTAQVYHPTTLVGDIEAPVTVAAPGQAQSFAANWTQARLSISGVPPNPDSISISLEKPHIDSVTGANTTTLFAADSAEWQSRVIGGSATNNPVIETVIRFSSAIAPTVHALLAQPLQGDLDVVLRGLKDLSPKPMAQRFRELQAANGSIEIKSLRIERTDAIVVGTGTLTLSQTGKLNGMIPIAVAGIENIVPQLGIDRLIDQGIGKLTGSQPGHGLEALDRLVPGLSGVVRQGASASVIDDIKKMGKPTQIDGKPAVLLPLRFADGAAYLGLIRIGEIPALY
jgi:hypothetical protein